MPKKSKLLAITMLTVLLKHNFCFADKPWKNYFFVLPAQTVVIRVSYLWVVLGGTTVIEQNISYSITLVNLMNLKVCVILALAVAPVKTQWC